MTDIAVIINNRAKNAHRMEDYLSKLRAHDIDYQLYKADPQQLEKNIQHCCSKYPLLLIGGGDGTVRSAAQWCSNTSVILGVLPLGTMNHFSKELNLPSTTEELIAAIVEKTTTTIDVAEVNGHIFINNSSIGFYSKLAKNRDYYTNFYNKWLTYIPSFIQALSYHPSYALLIKNKELDISIRTSFFMVSNNCYTYEFPLKFTRESFQNEQLGIYYYKRSKLRLFKFLIDFLTDKEHFEIIQTRLPLEVDVLHKNKITISLDGDTLAIAPPLYYKILPKSLKLLTKKI
ncbi:diacylglycerol kinase family protein [Legionella pneumophila serogroup 1]|uniref:diacylglycerol/lipid kinase family protein n=1 Tax=Legionella pneumophila TaxID=446 RepID=UPI0007779237|nr:diacylglycerol kinase family protein [Legionella pneumophila]HDO8003142.1 NAD(+)/NADH kinase [Legionella pneumophila]HDO9975344.1 NAD(+)/NADH kinase [Legionella pneumophila]